MPALGVLTSGSDAPGLNAAIPAITRVAGGWNLTEAGQPTSDGWITETEALMAGTSAVTIHRLRRMEAIQGVLLL